MAAWSDHEEKPWRYGYRERVANLEPVSTPDATALHPCPTCNTAMDEVCPKCAVDSEPFPLEVWTFFADADLDQLVVDAYAEMGRRELARRESVERTWVAGVVLMAELGAVDERGIEGMLRTGKEILGDA